MSSITNPRRVSYPRLKSPTKSNTIEMSWPSPADAPPIDQNRVFKMTYETRDIHAATISSSSLNVISSLKEKIAEKNALRSTSNMPQGTPSRLHAMLQEQLGCEAQANVPPSPDYSNSYDQQYDTDRNIMKYEVQRSNQQLDPEPEYERFRGEQSNKIPSKVFQALQYCYPGVDEIEMRQRSEPDQGTEYGSFRGNQSSSAVPSKVFQALQQHYPGEDQPPPTSAMEFARSQHWENENVGMRSSASVPSRSFKMLQRQYSDETDPAKHGVTSDLQDALDLLEQELESMTTSKRNPIITVPLSKGQYSSKNNNGVDAASSQSAPPLPVRRDSKKYQIPSKFNEDEEIMEAPVARTQPVHGDSRRYSSTSKDSGVMQAPMAQTHQGSINSPGGRPFTQNREAHVMVAPVAHVEKVVAYSAEVEKPWMNPKREDRSRTNPALSVRNQSQSNIKSAIIPQDRGAFKPRSDSFDSMSSHSSQSDRTVADFDPDTYVITRKSHSISSQGIRSDSSDSSHSLSSQASGLEPRFENCDGSRNGGVSNQQINMPQNRAEAPQNRVGAPRKMIISVNGRGRETSKGSKSSNDADCSSGANCNRSSVGVNNDCSDGSHCELADEAAPSKMKIIISTKGSLKNKQRFNNDVGHDDVEQDDVFETDASKLQSDQPGAEMRNYSKRSSNHVDDQFEKANERFEKGVEQQRMPTPLKNLQEMMDMFEVDAFEDEVKRRGSMPGKNQAESIEEVDEETCLQSKIEKEPESENCIKELEALQLMDLNTEEIQEVHVVDSQSTLMSRMEDKMEPNTDFAKNEDTKGRTEISTDPRPSFALMTAVHVQSRKQQQQLSCMPAGTRQNTRQSRTNHSDHAMSPVNVQVQKNTRRCSMPVEKFSDDKDKLKKSCQSVSDPSPASKIPLAVSPSRSQSSSGKKQQINSAGSSVPEEAIIVASEVSDDDELSPEKLQRTFEMINATADRILDQIDKVGSIGSESYYSDGYALDDDNSNMFADQPSSPVDSNQNRKGQASHRSSKGDRAQNNGYLPTRHNDENNNDFEFHGDNQEYTNRKPSDRSAEECLGFNQSPLRVSSRKVAPNVTRSSTAVRVTIPAISIKVRQTSSTAGQSKTTTVQRTAKK